LIILAFCCPKTTISSQISLRVQINRAVSAGSIVLNLRGVDCVVRLFEVTETGIAVIRVTCKEISVRKQSRHKWKRRIGTRSISTTEVGHFPAAKPSCRAWHPPLPHPPIVIIRFSPFRNRSIMELAMKPEPSFRRGVTLVLRGAGFFQLFAEVTATFFGTFTGEWERYMSATVSTGMLAWPATCFSWRKYSERTR
jgi:hypothetical protein